MNFEQACAEMEYIINHMEPSERAKIPQEVKKFFTQNKDYTYTVNLDYTKNLSDEKLKEETEAFIEIIYNKYLKNNEYKNITKVSDTDTKNQELALANKQNVFSKLFLKLKNIFKRK